jgi:thioredoxin-related protein
MKQFILLLIVLNLSSCASRNKEENRLPSFNLLLIDSTTIFNSSQIPEGRPFVLMYFSPDCEHCQEETASILKNIASFKKTKFFFITNDSFDRLKVYNQYYKIKNYPNVILGRDFHYDFFRHFKPRATPYILIYDKAKRLRTVFSGKPEIKTLLENITEL